MDPQRRKICVKLHAQFTSEFITGPQILYPKSTTPFP